MPTSIGIDDDHDTTVVDNVRLLVLVQSSPVDAPSLTRSLDDAGQCQC